MNIHQYLPTNKPYERYKDENQKPTPTLTMLVPMSSGEFSVISLNWVMPLCRSRQSEAPMSAQIPLISSMTASLTRTVAVRRLVDGVDVGSFIPLKGAIH